MMKTCTRKPTQPPEPMLHLGTPEEITVWTHAFGAALSLANSAHVNMTEKAGELADAAVMRFRDRMKLPTMARPWPPGTTGTATG